MEIRHISDYLGLGYHGHHNFDFVDAYLLKDNRLFIDPCLLERAQDDWCREAAACVQSFFDSLFAAFRSHDEMRLWHLYSHAHEQNATKLGYGMGYNGKAKTPGGLRDSLRPLSELACQIDSIGKALDVPVLIDGFAEDCLSDLLTNILHEQLNHFTAEQMARYNRKPNDEMSFWTWDTVQGDWIQKTCPCWRYNGKELLLVPKQIVRKHFLFKAHQYLYMVIIDRQREANDWQGLSKRDIWKNMRRETKHWEYKLAIAFTQQNPNALSEYHERLPKYYNRKYGGMSDHQLDKEVYSHRSSKSA